MFWWIFCQLIGTRKVASCYILGWKMVACITFPHCVIALSTVAIWYCVLLSWKVELCLSSLHAKFTRLIEWLQSCSRTWGKLFYMFTMDSRFDFLIILSWCTNRWIVLLSWIQIVGWIFSHIKWNLCSLL